MLVAKMIYGRKTKHSLTDSGCIRLQHEKSGAILSGFGTNGYVRLIDKQGNVWSGVAERGADNLVHYHLRDRSGRALTGIATELIGMFRDDENDTWKGFFT